MGEISLNYAEFVALIYGKNPLIFWKSGNKSLELSGAPLFIKQHSFMAFYTFILFGA